MSEEKSGSTGKSILVASGIGIAGIIAFVLLIIIVACVVIAILALLGPQIGNVFSQINADLGAATPIP